MRQELIDHCSKFMPVSQEYLADDRMINTLYVGKECPGKDFNVVYAYVDADNEFNQQWHKNIMKSKDFLPGYHIEVMSVLSSAYKDCVVKPYAFVARPKN